MRRDAKAIDSAEIYSSQVLHAEKRTPGKMIEEIKGEKGSSVDDARLV